MADVGGLPAPSLVDQLIEELVQARRQATPTEIARILSRMAGASFAPNTVKVPIKDRGHSYRGQTLGSQANSLDYHLVKRVIVEEEWSPGTTAAEYVADLQRVVQQPGARLVLFPFGSHHRAMALTATNRVIPSNRLGSAPLPLLIVVYSTDRGALITGYQVSSISKVNIPTGAVWPQ